MTTSGGDLIRNEIPVTKLSSILTEAGIDHIHVLKVDVKGLEEKVLNGNDWEKFRREYSANASMHLRVRLASSLQSARNVVSGMG